MSSEIETLQTKSTALNTRLENRKIVEGLLGPAVEEISISPTVVKHILDGQIDETWLKSLAELQKRLKVVETKVEGPDKIKAATDIKPLLEGLATKVGAPILRRDLANSYRRSSVSETTLWLRSKQSDHLTSMFKLYSNRNSSNSRTFIRFLSGIMHSLQTR